MATSWLALLVLSCCMVAAYAPAAGPLAGATRHSAAPRKLFEQQHQPCSLLCWARQQLGASNDWSGLRPSHVAFASAAAPQADAMRHGAVSHAAPASKHQQQQHYPCSLLCRARRQLGESNNWYGLRPIHAFTLDAALPAGATRDSAVLHAAPASKPPQQQQYNDWGGLRPVLDDNWNRTDARRPTQGSAYANWEGPDSEDEPGPPFSAYSTESTSVGPPGGTYYHEDGDQALALDAQLGVWGGQTVWKSNKHKIGGRYKYRPNLKRQNPQRTSAEDADVFSNTTSHFTLEFGDQRGMNALSGTYEGARAASGSHTSFNLATKDSIGGHAYTNNNDVYGPSEGKAALARNGETRSVAFTDHPPNSAAVSGTGYGAEAQAAGWEVAATARSGRDPEQPAELRPTIGHRPPGENGIFDAVSSSRGLRKMLQQLPAAQGPAHAGQPGTLHAAVSAFLGAARYRLLQLWVPRWSGPVSQVVGPESVAPQLR